MTPRYLYGAAVQGIQSFIFQSNKLREIVGASELVEEVCKDLFIKNVQGYHLYNGTSGAILNASGHIKYIFDDRAKCEELVKIFPKIVQEHAPGITFSQAVVEMTGDFANEYNAVTELERRLKIQRNKPMRSQTLGLMGIQRSRQTGLPAVYLEPKKSNDEYDYFDDLAYRKIYIVDSNGKKTGKRQYKTICQKAFPDYVDYKNVMIDLEENNGNNDWIAVIHIDGNNLGNVVESVWQTGGATEFKQFSEKLTNAVQQSAIDAYECVKNKYFDEKEFIPIRPLILSGEDYNLICRADFAIEYVEAFLSKFEEETKFINGFIKVKANLTACAGIAFVKSSFPFYYAYNLAEELCSYAKNKSEREKSCLMFHKVQDSFSESYDEIVKRELTPKDGLSMRFGPYYIDNAPEGFWTIQTLLEKANSLDSKEGNAVKAHLRQWIDLLSEPNDIAKQKLKRLELITTMEKVVKEVTTPRESDNAFPTYDILTVHTIKTQTTK